MSLYQTAFTLELGFLAMTAGASLLVDNQEVHVLSLDACVVPVVVVPAGVS